MARRHGIEPRCSFCGKKQDQVERLVAGPGVFICDECVRLCNEVIDERPPVNPTGAGSGRWVKRTNRPRGLFWRLFRTAAMEAEG